MVDGAAKTVIDSVITANLPVYDEEEVAFQMAQSAGHALEIANRGLERENDAYESDGEMDA